MKIHSHTKFGVMVFVILSFGYGLLIQNARAENGGVTVQVEVGEDDSVPNEEPPTPVISNPPEENEETTTSVVVPPKPDDVDDDNGNVVSSKPDDKKPGISLGRSVLKIWDLLNLIMQNPIFQAVAVGFLLAPVFLYSRFHPLKSNPSKMQPYFAC